MRTFATSILFLTFFLIRINAFTASEFFLHTEKQGYYSVTISDQTLISSSNYFRFFDLAHGNHTLTITDIMTGTKLYSGTVTLSQNTRKVVRMDAAWRLFPVSDVGVNWVNWYTQGGTNSGIGTQSGITTTTTGTTANTPPPIDFGAAKAKIDAESFDNRKLEVAKSITSKTSLTSDQIAEICQLFSFDNSKLEYAKYAYDYCSDKPNYFKVSSTFTFSSYARDLEKYIKSR
ncbi:MAG: DUF4476 domain-containing protein [Flavobacteriales bacterium]